MDEKAMHIINYSRNYSRHEIVKNKWNLLYLRNSAPHT